MSKQHKGYTNQKISILVGIITRDSSSLTRLLKSIKKINNHNMQLDYCVFINAHEYDKPKLDLGLSSIEYIYLEENQSFLDIANARNFLQNYIVQYSNSLKMKPFIWLLDEDLEINNPKFNDYLLQLPKLKKDGFDVLIGGIEGDSPNACFSGMQVQLFDLYENLKWLSTLDDDSILPDMSTKNETLRAKYPDYYYDLSSKHSEHLNTMFYIEPIHLSETVKQAKTRIYENLNNILSGKNIFRPIFPQESENIQETLLRGPNTFILNIETLNIKHPVMAINNICARRSDMMWALINKEFCYKSIVKVNFSVKHHRQYSIEEELNESKTSKENYGSVIFNALKVFYTDSNGVTFKEIIEDKTYEKITLIENSIKTTKLLINKLENLNCIELIPFCTKLRDFYNSTNENIIIKKLHELPKEHKKIILQFEKCKPTIRNYCNLERNNVIFKQYDLHNDNIKLFSKQLIENMNKNIPPLVRIHDACCNSEVFKATDCDCASQLDKSFSRINNEENGMIFYVNQEGRGHGYSKKIAIVNKMQIEKISTYESGKKLGLKDDIRDYEEVAKLLKEFGWNTIRLLSNNPKKQENLKKYGITAIPEEIRGEYTKENIDYLISKEQKGNHKNLLITKKILKKLYPEKEDLINFYQKEDSYGEFSNFSDFPFVCEDMYWRTSEHYYQAQKFDKNSKTFNQIQKAKTPTIAKEIAQSNQDTINTNWDKQKIPFMYNALISKFSQDNTLKELLLSTNSKYIIDKTENDEFWGSGENHNGDNILGRLLMHTRTYFKDQK